MQNSDDDFDKDEEPSDAGKISHKKILFILVPVLIVIGIAVGGYYIFNRSYDNDSNLNYSIVKNITDENGTQTENITVFYDLPEVAARISDASEHTQTVKMKISLELSKVEDIKNIESMLPRINDAVIAHTVELEPEEINGSAGLYWLKEELLYRINLLVSPVKVSNLNFKNFETQNSDENKG